MTGMGRCKDCRWWQTPMRETSRITATQWDESNQRYVFTYEKDEYAEKPINPGWRVCTRADREGRLMLVGGHEDGPIETAPEFGCTMFEGA